MMAWPLGGLVALFCFFGRGRFSPMFLFGGLLFLAGIAFSNAYAWWGEGWTRIGWHRPTQEQLQERERTRLRRGHNLGLIILFAWPAPRSPWG